MRGLECKCRIFPKKIFLSCFFLVAFLASLVLSVGFSLNASAISYGNSDTIYLITANSWATVPGSNPVVPFASGDALVYTIPNNGTVTDFSFGLQRALSNNAHVISFTLNFNFGQSSQALYRSPQWQAGVTLFDSCVGGMDPSGSYVKTSFSCHYTVLITGAIYQVRTVPNLTWISNVPTGSGGNLEITVSPISSIPLVNSDLSSSDIQQLSSNITSALEDLEISVEGSAGATPEQIQQATVSAIQQTQQSERQQLESEAQSAQNTLDNNSDQQAISTKFTSILAIIDNFVFAITHPTVSTCILPIDLRNYTGASFYEVDLCHLSPPSGITTVLNVIFIFFVLGLAYSAIRSVVQMYKEVIDG